MKVKFFEGEDGKEIFMNLLWYGFEEYWDNVLGFKYLIPAALTAERISSHVLSNSASLVTPSAL